MPSKLCLHHLGDPGDWLDWTKQVAPVGCKFVDYDSDMTIPAFPGQYRVWRKAADGLTYDNPVDEFLRRLPLAKLRGVIWGGLNEKPIETEEHAIKCNTWNLAYTRAMHGRGERVALPDWSTSWPRKQDFDKLLPLMLPFLAETDFLAVHAYANRYGFADIQNVLNLVQWLKAHGVVKPVLVTEAGRDDGGPGQGPWGPAQLTPDAYETELETIDHMFRTEPLVKAVYVYSTIGANAGPQWGSFDLEPMRTRLGSYIVSQREVPDPTPTPQPEQPIYDLSADKTTIAVGESVTLSWHIEHVREGYLEGRPITGPTGSMRWTVMETHAFTLRVVLLDGSELTRTVTVTVQAATASEPADPRLRAFPRPPNDNGRGMHAGLDCRRNDRYDDFTDNLTRMQAAGVKWVVWYTPSADAARICVEESQKYGIMPIIRPKTKINQPCDFVGYARACPAKTYFLIYNEPGNPREWVGPVPRDYINIWAARWQNAAKDIVANGGLPGLQAIGEEEFKAALTGLDPAVARWVWIGSHTVPANHPPDYPYNEGYTVFKNKKGEIEDVTQLKFLLDAKYAFDALGFVPPIIVTEEGYVMNKWDDQEEMSPGVPRYPRINADLHARYSVAIYDQFRTGRLANGEPLPDWLFAYCPFLWGGTPSAQDWQDFAWFLGADNPATKWQTINAVTAIPPFVRQFGGTAPPEEPPDTALDEVIDELESALNSAENLTTALQIALDKARKLKK